MTSLFVMESQLPRRSVIDWVGLNAPPFTDQAWQPRVWWRMSRDACPDAAALETDALASDTAIASAKTREIRLRNMSLLFVFLRVSASHGKGASVLATWRLRICRSYHLFSLRPLAELLHRPKADDRLEPAARGDSLRTIAEGLNQAGVPTAQGGARWYAATV